MQQQHQHVPGNPTEEAAAEIERSKLHAVLKLASEASRSNKAVPLNPICAIKGVPDAAPKYK